eukprot:CAMPEP_0195516424 /NCGR_PEP_ID=MMETSP0794_2-20130614/7151_1 /TAXON_ID=515487 /ORGANISM="Stephanopyxis turris, Strain CCMP 815" /LENGTH=505 /DNA_ID=CAMNT_0040645009 /DNA_START=535 /DNA_END=2052 /DNA_ORIENTATION=-
MIQEGFFISHGYMESEDPLDQTTRGTPTLNTSWSYHNNNRMGGVRGETNLNSLHPSILPGNLWAFLVNPTARMGLAATDEPFGVDFNRVNMAKRALSQEERRLVLEYIVKCEPYQASSHNDKAHGEKGNGCLQKEMEISSQQTACNSVVICPLSPLHVAVNNDGNSNCCSGKSIQEENRTPLSLSLANDNVENDQRNTDEAQHEGSAIASSSATENANSAVEQKEETNTCPLETKDSVTVTSPVNNTPDYIPLYSNQENNLDSVTTIATATSTSSMSTSTPQEKDEEEVIVDEICFTDKDAILCSNTCDSIDHSSQNTTSSNYSITSSSLLQEGGETKEHKNDRIAVVIEEEKNFDHLCAICLDEFESGELVNTPAKCPHLFHKECLFLWLDKHNVCPCCRTELVTCDELEKAIFALFSNDSSGSAAPTNVSSMAASLGLSCLFSRGSWNVEDTSNRSSSENENSTSVTTVSTLEVESSTEEEEGGRISGARESSTNLASLSPGI